MGFEHIVTYFLPRRLKGRAGHPQYAEYRIVVSTVLTGVLILPLFPLVLSLIGRPVTGFLINEGLLLLTLLSVKFLGHYRVPMTTTALATYYIIYEWVAASGWIYSSNVSILHMYLLGAIWADKRYGWWAIFTNLGMFGLIYGRTLQAGLPSELHPVLGGPLYALLMNSLITVFFGGFLAYLQFDQERDRARIRALQEQKISLLDEAVKERTEQLNGIRESIATDFHDETGNMLSAITRQATLLRQRIGEHEARPMVESIIRNSKDLYNSSKDFLWHLNHNSDEPQELFDHLTAYGQQYYNQFDIAFASEAGDRPPVQFAPSAALNLIYIFKEAMTNVVKHSGAGEVSFRMDRAGSGISFRLADNGRWQEPDPRQAHYGLSNIERRCAKNRFRYTIDRSAAGTTITILAPVHHG